MTNLSFIIAGIGIGAALFGIASILYTAHLQRKDEERELRLTMDKHTRAFAYLEDRMDTNFKHICSTMRKVDELNKEVELINERLNHTTTTSTQQGDAEIQRPD